MVYRWHLSSQRTDEVFASWRRWFDGRESGGSTHTTWPAGSHVNSWNSQIEAYPPFLTPDEEF